MLREDRGGEWREVPISQGLPATTGCWEGARYDFPRAFRGSMALLTPWFHASRLQNCEHTYFCCFKPRSS